MLYGEQTLTFEALVVVFVVELLKLGADIFQSATENLGLDRPGSDDRARVSGRRSLSHLPLFYCFGALDVSLDPQQVFPLLLLLFQDAVRQRCQPIFLIRS